MFEVFGDKIAFGDRVQRQINEGMEKWRARSGISHPIWLYFDGTTTITFAEWSSTGRFPIRKFFAGIWEKKEGTTWNLLSTDDSAPIEEMFRLGQTQTNRNCHPKQTFI